MMKSVFEAANAVIPVTLALVPSGTITALALMSAWK
jgi:hypothetical protein